METEHLQMILEMLGNAGAGTASLVIAYFVLLLLKVLIPAAASIAAVWIITTMVRKLVSFLTFGMVIRDTLGVGSTGELTGGEKREVLRRLAELQQKERELESLKRE